MDLSKQQALDADPKAIKQINFTANLDRAGQTAMYFIIEEAKETAGQPHNFHKKIPGLFQYFSRKITLFSRIISKDRK